MHMTNWIWIVVGIILGESIALSQIAIVIPKEVVDESRVTTIRHWLKNSKVDLWALIS